MSVTMLLHGGDLRALWAAWGGEPLALAGLVLGATCYARGVAGLWRHAGRGALVTGRQVALAGAALGLLAIALLSPLEALAGELFSAHMVQHVVLTTLAAPLLVLSRPMLALLQGLPHRPRRRAAALHARARTARWLTYRTGWPVAAAGLHAAVIWLWHLPAPYEAAVRSDLVHGLEHASLVGSAVLLWWAVAETGRRNELSYGMGIAAVFAVALAHGALGAVLTFSPTVLYGEYAATTAAWGAAPLADQQLAGVLMWAPVKAVHGAAVVALAVGWLQRAERHARARESAEAGSPGSALPSGR